MIRALIPALALALLARPAMAQDPRLVEVMYDETKVVRIDGRVAVQASIMFGDDEVIENVAIGDSATWQVTPNKRANILFVKPLEPRASPISRSSPASGPICSISSPARRPSRSI